MILNIKKSKNHISYNVDYDFADYTITLKSLTDTHNFDLWDFETGLVSPLDESVKQLFEQKFAFVEIGFPTAERFKHELKTMFLENHPRWNRLFNLYEDVLSKDPLIESKLSTSTNLASDVNQIVDGQVNSETEQTTTGSTSGTGSSESSTRRRFNDTPESSVSSLDDGFLSGLQDEETESTSSSTATDNSSNTIEATTKDEKEIKTETEQTTTSETIGFSKQEIDLLTNYKNQYLDIVSSIVGELRSLFIYLY